MSSWFLVELGGSSAQTAQRDLSGRFWFTPGIVRAPQHPVALACPGVIRNGQVLYATNLGWPATADPRRELGIDAIQVIENDAVAAALGESVLRSGDVPDQNLVYISLGTGVGSAQVLHRHGQDFDLGHYPVGGTTYCTGCRSIGCLNSVLAAAQLPSFLTNRDHVFIAETLVHALQGKQLPEHTLLVLGGGITRRYPALVLRLRDRLPNAVELTAAPREAKSCVFAGLDYLTRVYTHNGARV